MASPQRLSLISQELTAQAELGEHSFKDAEQWRQKVGFLSLNKLLSLNNPSINNILKNITIPEDFDFKRDWLEPTSTYEFGTEPEKKLFIKGSKSENIQIMGIRVRDNIVTRTFTEEQITEAGLISPDGGGVRVSFVKAEEVNGQWTITKASEAKEKMFNEANGLASAMVPKNTALEFRERLSEVLIAMNPKNLQELLKIVNKIFIGGGAKGDIIVALPQEISELEAKGGDSIRLAGEMKKELVCKALFAAGYNLAEQGAYNPLTGRYAGDKNTTGTVGGRSEMEWLSDGALAFNHDSGQIVDQTFLRAGVSGKSADGLSSRFYATGLGGWESTKAFADLNRIDLVGKRLMSRGVGSAVNRGLIEAAKAGVIIECLADASGIIVKQNGSFSTEEIEELYQVSVEQQASMVDWARNKEDVIVYYAPSTGLSEEIRNKELAIKVTDFWQEYRPEIIDDAAKQETINEETAQYIPEGVLLCEYANGATTPKAAEILENKHVQRIPGINLNSGGVFVSWFEWAQSILKINFPPKLIDQAVAKMMQDNMRDTLSLMQAAKENGIPHINQEAAFYALAIAKGLKEKERVQEIMSIVS